MAAYMDGKIIENAKEMFRKLLCDSVPDKDVLLNKSRIPEREELGRAFKVPVEAMMATSDLYKDIAERLTGKAIPQIENARDEILDALAPYGIVN